MHLRAIIFDLDGVITDTAEYHYRAWQRLADEEGLPFNRAINERLRGVGRRASLEIILAGRPATEAQIAEMTERKNRYYVAMIGQVTPADLLPGALELLRELRQVGVKIGIGSVSKNTPTVIERLGIAELLDAVADGRTVERSQARPRRLPEGRRDAGRAAGFLCGRGGRDGGRRCGPGCRDVGRRSGDRPSEWGMRTCVLIAWRA